MKTDKHILTFSEMNEIQEKLKTKLDRPHRKEMDQIKSEISQKLKQLDDMLTTEPAITIESEPVAEILERLNYLLKKMK